MSLLFLLLPYSLPRYHLFLISFELAVWRSEGQAEAKTVLDCCPAVGITPPWATLSLEHQGPYLSLSEIPHWSFWLQWLFSSCWPPRTYSRLPSVMNASLSSFCCWLLASGRSYLSPVFLCMADIHLLHEKQASSLLSLDAQLVSNMVAYSSCRAEQAIALSSS